MIGALYPGQYAIATGGSAAAHPTGQPGITTTIPSASGTVQNT